MKSQHLARVFATLRDHAAADSLVIGLQNGIRHLPLFQQQRPGRFAIGVTAQGATLVAPGHTRHGGNGMTCLGFPDTASDPAPLQRTAEIFCRCQLNSVVEKDIIQRLWHKLIINCGINGLTVLYDCPNGELLKQPERQKRLAQLVNEAAAVARAQGITISGDPVARTMDVCRATANNISSMLQDIRANRQTEIMAINGALVEIAQHAKIDVPENRLLLRQVMELEGRRKL